MNGISVMACVQTGQPGFRSVYGRENRMQQKYIVISHQSERSGTSAVNGRTSKASGSEPGNVCAGQDRRLAAYAERRKSSESAGRKSTCKDSAGREAVRRASAGTQTVDKSGRSRSSRSTRKSSAGRRSAFAIRTLVLAVIFAGMLAGFQMMTRASSREKEQTYKYYTTVTIGYGEDLSDIVYQYCDRSEYESADAYVREICDINSLPYHKGIVPDLGAGSKIVIPYYSTEVK